MVVVSILPHSEFGRKYLVKNILLREFLADIICGPKDVFIAEGKFAGMFGWNLTHRPIGGFMGLPGINRNTFCPIQLIMKFKHFGL